MVASSYPNDADADELLRGFLLQLEQHGFHRKTVEGVLLGIAYEIEKENGDKEEPLHEVQGEAGND